MFTLLALHRATKKKGTLLKVPGKRSFYPHTVQRDPVFMTFIFNIFFPSSKKLSPFSYEKPVLSSRLTNSSSFWLFSGLPAVSTAGLSTGYPVAASLGDQFCPKNYILSFFNRFWARHTRPPSTEPGMVLDALYHPIWSDSHRTYVLRFDTCTFRWVSNFLQNLTPRWGAALGFRPRPCL